MPHYEQPGRITTFDANGKKTVTVTLLGIDEAPLPTGITGSVKSKKIVKAEAGLTRTEYQIEADSSTGPSGNADGVVVEIISTVRTVPIEAHPNFSEKYLSSQDKKKIKDAVLVPDRSPTFEDIKNKERAISLYGYLINGVESYYVPSIVVRKTYQASSPPNNLKIGKIANLTMTVPGMPPGSNFLLINITARGASGNYQITEEYEMSGQGGWDSYLYG